MSPDKPSLNKGLAVIRDFSARLPDTPGVYRMLDAREDVLYVGKAKSLKKRVSSYAQETRLPIRMQRMVALTRDMTFVHTHTEAEALLLESNLIKQVKPRFNILLRDDKSYPYILITGDHEFPLVTKHRGAKKRKGHYYGPFARVGDVNRTIAILQRAFMLRNCSDNVFSGRSRPCLQYHIKRCTAPCVGKISKAEYEEQVEEARAFLDGKSAAIQDRMAKAMHRASRNMQYEEAARYRDRIKALTSVQSHQNINVKNLAHADVIALAEEGGVSCIQVFFFRAGRNYGNRAYFPRHSAEERPHDILAAFIGQFYANKPVPREILVTHMPQDKALIEEALSSRADYKVRLACPKRGARKNLIHFAVRNAREALGRHISVRAGEEETLKKLAGMLELEDIPERIEVYDNSHISGSHMTGAMIVAGPEGFQKNAYRKFNIRMSGAADDYAMMREVLTRRFTRALEKDGEESKNWPALVLIDGGKGQLSSALDVMEELGISGSVPLAAIAKGPDRHAGRETIYRPGGAPINLKDNDPLLHYLQRLRDEAHRFAVGAHRTRRKKAIGTSPLDEIPGIGPKRKKALLNYFGSARAVASAGVNDLQKVDGISKARAQKLYDHFH